MTAKTFLDEPSNPKDDVSLCVAKFMRSLEHGSTPESGSYAGLHYLSVAQVDCIIEELVECGSIVRRNGRLFRYDQVEG